MNMQAAWMPPAINAKGLKPFQSQLDLIDAAKSKQDLAPLIANLHLNGVNVFFRTRSDQDFANSTRVIAFFAAGGLGLPERDFYTRTDPKSVEQRNQYVEHVTNTFKLMGESPTKAASDAQTVLAIETRLAKASLTVTERRNPQNINHPMKLSALESTVPNFDFKYVPGYHEASLERRGDSWN